MVKSKRTKKMIYKKLTTEQHERHPIQSGVLIIKHQAGIY